MQEIRNILVVEDELDLAELLRYNLNVSGHKAEVAHSGAAAIEAVAAKKPDLIILDIMLPEMDGIEVATKLKRNAETASIPIIMLTAKSADEDQIRGLDAGADDYVTKPFSIKVLLARVDAVLRRASKEAGASSIVELGPVRIDLDRHEASCAGESIKLTLTEFRLLAALMQAPGRVLSRRGLISNAIGPGITVTERTIDVHVAAIRKKLGEYGSMIQTVRGVGYRINDPDA
ncbi:MAG: response regulator [Phycisphaerales bacterium JB061]|jgi:two-component system phosphate regulon response regulator PhoB